MPDSKRKKKSTNAKMPPTAERKPGEVTFASLQDFEEKMFPRAVAGRSLRYDGDAARALGEQLGDALARGVAGRLDRTSP